MNERQHPRPGGTNSGRIWAGIIIVAIGAVLLADKLNVDWLVPGWLISWPMLLIVIGLIIGGKSNFKRPAAFIILGIGLFFLTQRITHFNIGQFFWPLIIISIGLWLLLDRRGRCQSSGGGPNRYNSPPGGYEWDKRVDDDAAEGNGPAVPYDAAENAAPAETGPALDEADNNNGPGTGFAADDYLKSTAVFSEIKKIVISKHFSGGEVVNIFGGTHINLIQADIQAPVVIDVFQLFAGTKIIVPAHWKIRSEVVAVFGEVDDRRFIQGIPQDEQKTVYIRGTSIFGGVTIKSV